MRYLFFDIECSNGKNICEFGYVIADEQFNILEKKDIIINPESKFNLVGRPGGRDLFLHYSEEEYYQSKKFDYFYYQIKELIEHQDQIIIGHSIKNDAYFLNVACKRYKLEPINFKFADSQKMFSEFFNNKKETSLENAIAKFNIEIPKLLHKSDEDSKLTMQLVKSMCENLECNVKELISLCVSCTGVSNNFEVKYNYGKNKIIKQGNNNSEKYKTGKSSISLGDLLPEIFAKLKEEINNSSVDE